VSEPRRALGWRKDPDDAEYAEHGHLVRALRARGDTLPPLPVADLRPFRGEPIYQGGVGACFAFDLTRRFQVWNNARGLADDLVSPRVLYWAGRAQEFAGVDPELVEPQMTDSGTYPSLGYRAVERVGFVPWNRCPYPSDEDAWDPVWIDQVVHHSPPPAIWADAFSQRGLETARVMDDGIDRVRSVALLLTERLVPGFGMQVDLPFLRNRGERITNVNPALLQGGHAMSVLAVVNPDGSSVRAGRIGVAPPDEVLSWDVVVDNWWEDWGAPDGTGRIAAGLFGSDWISDVTTVNFVPRVFDEART
jgi:hypothetical protein